MDLALFDFDGTITIDPTYPAFVRFAVRTSVGLKSAQFLWQAGPHERVTIGSVRVETVISHRHAFRVVADSDSPDHPAPAC